MESIRLCHKCDLPILIVEEMIQEVSLEDNRPTYFYHLKVSGLCDTCIQQFRKEEEEFLEDEAAVSGRAGGLQLRQRGSVRRVVDFVKRRFSGREVEALQHGGGQAFGHIAAHAFEQVEDGPALPQRRQARTAQ